MLECSQGQVEEEVVAIIETVHKISGVNLELAIVLEHDSSVILDLESVKAITNSCKVEHLVFISHKLFAVPWQILESHSSEIVGFLSRQPFVVLQDVVQAKEKSADSAS